ncbi:MAG: LOG family protein [Acidobacteriaceae bacterium]|nr:LOG family protein [Acidobacteriaceae bacterium]MBV9226988.1 LOG family protein [Acidobacteriaceae bacterium]MBV9678294.1 LOG family protein [Acidobacteriaceae bacterium]MBV9940216.1 LOG family protein [Acidobacteriaceae bacterium]
MRKLNLLQSEDKNGLADTNGDQFHRPLAYREEAFLQSPDSRPLRILSEYLWPLSHFQSEKIQDTVVFFGSARLTEDGPLGRYYRDARELARLVTLWAESVSVEDCKGDRHHRFVICSGGGPGIMEAANRGASDAGGKNIGLNIGLPFEQRPNPYITPELNFEFHYFFMRKFWFAYLAKAIVVFPGGFGTLDELTEILTLAQTKKLESKILIVLYGSEFWHEILNFDALVKHGVISESDLNLFRFADSPQSALDTLKEGLTRYYLEPERALQHPIEEAPEIAHSRTS